MSNRNLPSGRGPQTAWNFLLFRDFNRFGNCSPVEGPHAKEKVARDPVMCRLNDGSDQHLKALAPGSPGNRDRVFGGGGTLATGFKGGLGKTGSRGRAPDQSLSWHDLPASTLFPTLGPARGPLTPCRGEPKLEVTGAPCRCRSATGRTWPPIQRRVVCGQGSTISRFLRLHALTMGGTPPDVVALFLLMLWWGKREE